MLDNEAISLLTSGYTMIESMIYLKPMDFENLRALIRQFPPSPLIGASGKPLALFDGLRWHVSRPQLVSVLQSDFEDPTSFG